MNPSPAHRVRGRRRTISGPVHPGTTGFPTAALTICPLFAEAGAAQPPEDDHLRDLLKLLGNQTELAIKTGMNADFIPGIATILSDADMLARGPRTIWESL